MNITAKEIARRLGISRQAVYSVLSKKAVCHVSPEKKAEILFLAQAYHYRPNTAALQLNGMRTHRIGAVVDSLQGINAEFLMDLSLRLLAMDYRLHSMPFLGVQQGLDAIAGFVNEGMDGVFFSGNYIPAEHRKIGIPAVSLGIETAHDLQGGAEKAAEHLIRVHGHRRILYLSVEPRGSGRFLQTDRSDKYLGYCKAMEEAGLEPLPLLHTLENSDFEKELLAAIRGGVTAVLVTGNNAAMHLIYQLKLRGIRVPEDIAVMGFHCGMKIPGLSTVFTDHARLAQEAADMMIRKIRNDERDICESVFIPTVLRTDISCGCPGRLESNYAFRYGAFDQKNDFFESQTEENAKKTKKSRKESGGKEES